MSGDIDVTIAALNAGQYTAASLAAKATNLAIAAKRDCDQGAAAATDWGPFAAALRGAGVKMDQALGESGNAGVAGALNLTSSKLGQCAAAYERAEAKAKAELAKILGQLNNGDLSSLQPAPPGHGAPSIPGGTDSGPSGSMANQWSGN